MHFTSYAGCTGTWYHPSFNPVRQAQINGLFWIQSSVGLQGITDGTSQTIIYGERAHALLSCDVPPGGGVPPCIEWHWWTSGAFGDMMFSTLYPVNPQGKVVNDNAGGVYRLDRVHPGCVQHASGRCEFRHGRRIGAIHQGHGQFLADRPEHRSTRRNDARRQSQTLQRNHTVRRLPGDFFA